MVEIREATKARYRRYTKLLRDGAKALGLKATDSRVSQWAVLQLSKENTIARMLDGKPADPADILRLDAAIKELTPKSEHVIKFEYVEGVAGLFDCPHCHKRSEVKDYHAPPAPLPPQSVIDLQASPALHIKPHKR